MFFYVDNIILGGVMLCCEVHPSKVMNAEVIETLTKSETMLASLKLFYLSCFPITKYQKASRWFDKVADNSDQILNEYYSLPQKKQNFNSLKKIIFRITGEFHC